MKSIISYSHARNEVRSPVPPKTVDNRMRTKSKKTARGAGGDTTGSFWSWVVVPETGYR